MVFFPVLDVGRILGQADHQPDALPEIFACLYQSGKHGQPCGAGIGTKGDSFALGVPLLRAPIAVRTL